MTPPERAAAKVETERGNCPSCGGPSESIRVIGGEDPAWRPAHCGACLREIEYRETQERHARHAAVALEDLHVPAMYASESLETFRLHGTEDERQVQARMVRNARRYISDWPDDVAMIVVMSGGFGTGKGHLCWSIAKELASIYLAVSRITVLSDLVRDLREAWNSEGGLSEAERLRPYRQAPLLIVDEVSRHAFYGQPQQHLYDLVAWREVRHKPTILTTNDSGPVLADLLGLALMSRVLRWNGLWEFGEKDWRLTHARRGAA